jgi:hypothetical protein
VILEGKVREGKSAARNRKRELYGLLKDGGVMDLLRESGVLVEIKVEKLEGEGEAV